MTTSEPNGTQVAESPPSKLARWWPLIALVIVVAALIVGELAFQWAKHRGWTTYTRADGLAGDIVTSVAFAHDGTPWVTTSYGEVSRFAGHGTSEGDASNWTTYDGPGGLASYDVGSIAVDLDGAVWIGSEGLGGVSRFDGQTWTTYNEEDGLAGDIVSGIAVAPDGTVWVAAIGGVSRFDGETWTTYTRADGLADNLVTSIAVAPDGALWAGTRHYGVSRFDPLDKGEAWTTYATAGRLAGPYVTSIAVAPDGTLWFGTWGYGISRFDPIAKGEAWTTYTTADGLADNEVRTIAVASDNTVWAGTWRYLERDRGVSRFDGETWSTFTTSNSGLANLQVQSLAIDEQGQVWMGTEGGLSVYNERVAVPARILQLWSFLRIGGLAASALLVIVWQIRRLYALPAPRRARAISGLRSRAAAGIIFSVLAILSGLMWWAQIWGLVDWPLFDSGLAFLVVPWAGLFLSSAGLALSVKAKGGDTKKPATSGLVISLLALLILAYPVLVSLLQVLLVASVLPVQ